MRFYQYLNALSIDVVVGAIICTQFFAKLFEADLPMVLLLTLALAVWSVYTIDHLWDARRSPIPSLTYRHYIHHRYFGPLLWVLAGALTAGGVLAFYLPDETRRMGIILTVFILVYFLTTALWSSKPVYHKELLISVVYCCGVILGPYSLKQIQISAFHMLVCCQFGTLALSNLLIFAYFDTDSDGKQHFGSLSRTIGKSKTRLIAFILLNVVFVSTVFSTIIWLDEPVIGQSQWVLALMTIPLAVILKWPAYFKQHDRFRVLGDITFFLPALAL